MNRLLSALIFSALLPGCLVMPHYQTLTGKIRGRVVDAKGEPISGAQVEYLYNAHRLLGSAKTDPSGTFEMGPFRQWFYVVYLGSPGVYPFPYTLDAKFDLPDALKLGDGKATALYLIGSQKQHLSTIPPTRRGRFALPQGVRWTGVQRFPTLMLRPDMHDTLVP